MPITSKRQGRRTYAPDATRQAILDSALALFEVNGFHATSVQTIADEAEVTKGAFYHHFRSKDELVKIIHDELLEHLLREQRRVLENGGDPAEQLRAEIEAIVDSVVRFRSHVAVYYQERRYLEGRRFDAVRRKRELLLERTAAIVGVGIEDGTFRADVDPAVTALGVDGTAAWAHQWLHPATGAEPEHVAGLLADMVLGGLTRR
jgi:AcrR family transcriptional regulator